MSRLSAIRARVRWWFSPIIQINLLGIGDYIRFFSEWRRYSRLPNAEPVRFRDARPMLRERVSTTSYDPHYFYQSI